MNGRRVTIPRLRAEGEREREGGDATSVRYFGSRTRPDARRRGLPFLAAYSAVLPAAILAQKLPADNRETSSETRATKLKRKAAKLLHASQDEKNVSRWTPLVICRFVKSIIFVRNVKKKIFHGRDIFSRII